MFDMGSLQCASDLSGREVLLRALLSFSKEDFSVRLPPYLDGIDEEVAAAFNAAAETNERFAEQTRRLEERMKQVELESGKVDLLKAALEDKAGQLARGPRYKPEFFASMSHVLRPPLNSMLILAKLLADNVGNNLSSKQIDYAQTIYSAGTHLLSLIDDILDLAKMESGTVDLDIAAEPFPELCKHFERAFRQVAQDKGLAFEVELAPGLPTALRTDGKRLQQILGILLSNAFKFTRQGGVTLRIAPAECDRTPTAIRSGGADQWVEFAVADTGVGIPATKQRSIFEAFHPAEGTTGREYGGTSLGLSICRELTRMLGGDIQVGSTEGAGSRFTLYLPLAHDGAPPSPAVLSAPVGKRHDAAHNRREMPSPPVAGPQPYRGPKSRQSDDGVVLIVEGDAQIASLMLGLVHSNGYQGEVATNLVKLRSLVRDTKPDAIILGMNLSDSDGWTAFDLLKHDPETRQLPVSMIYVNGHIHQCLQIGGPRGGAAAAMVTPLETIAGLSAVAGCDIRKLLVVDAAESRRPDAGAAWRLDGLEVTVLGTGAQVPDALRRGYFDGMVVDVALPDMTAIDLMKIIMAMELPADLPVAMVGMAGEADGAAAEIAILKRRNGFEEILAETTRFLYRAVGNHPSVRQEVPASRRRVTLDLAGRKALIVNDDIRNIYVMTGALEQQGMIVLHAENSAEGVDALLGNPDTDVVLIDTTMAGLNSHDMIDFIRGIEKFRSLPIIAVTAKARHGNREHCIAAGASDTIDKPINVEQLLSLLRAWLHESR